MANLRDYFDTDFSNALAFKKRYIVELVNSETKEKKESTELLARVHLDFNTFGKFISIYFPKFESRSDLLLAMLDDMHKFLELDKGFEIRLPSARLLPGSIILKTNEQPKRIITTFWGEDPVDSGDVAFTGRVFYYVEGDISKGEVAAIKDRAAKRKLNLQIRSEEFRTTRAGLEKPLAFICHDSRDKDEIARPLASRLATLMCTVWFDEYSLSVRDSLRETIERGIKECNKCILIVTPHFIGNEGWPKREFNAAFTKELFIKKDVILPVWDGVSSEQVYEYSPILADKFAAIWEEGIDVVSGKLYRQVISDQD